MPRIRNRPAFLAAAVALIFLTGCANQYEQWLGTRIGMPINRLIDEMGPPHEVKPGPNGTQFYTWSYREVESHADSGRGSFQYKNPGKKVKSNYCETRFVVGRNKRVKSWSYRGNDCDPPMS